VHPLPPTPDHTVLYDGDCGFCKCLMALVLAADRDARLAPAAIQSPVGERLLADLPEAERLASWHLVTPAGARSSGGAAIPTLLALLPGARLTAPVARRIPGSLDRGYRWVARHRVTLSRPIPRALKRRAAAAVARAERERTPAPVPKAG
jgi:predicted DCC family thiol-disulfide oxidoreductase YuxK